MCAIALVLAVGSWSLTARVWVRAASNGQEAEFDNATHDVWVVDLAGTNQNGRYPVYYSNWYMYTQDNCEIGYWWKGSLQQTEYNSNYQYLRTQYANVPTSEPYDWWLYNDQTGQQYSSRC